MGTISQRRHKATPFLFPPRSRFLLWMLAVQLPLCLAMAVPARAICGDGIIEAGEGCDDGNLTAGDCCSAACQLEGVGSPCDDGNACTTPDLCVGAACEGAGDPRCGIDLDHFKCYQAPTKRGTPKFVSRNVLLRDQFGTTVSKVGNPRTMCNPADKNGEGILDTTAHLTCHRIKEVSFGPGPFTRREVQIRNQFGDQTLTILKPLLLCVPSTKDGMASALEIDHFRCYKARVKSGTPPFEPRDVRIADQFETVTERASPCLRFCNPVDKNGEEIRDPDAHLTCYKLTDVADTPPFVARDVVMGNQFGEETLTARTRHTLCVPTQKLSVTPP